jgi:hypothetical protein
MENTLSEAGRGDYLTALSRIIIAPGEVSPKAIAKLYETFTLLETSQTERLIHLDKLVFDTKKLNKISVSREIMRVDKVRKVLAQDALFIGEIQPNPATKEAIAKLLRELQLSPEQISVMADWVSYENRFLKNLGAGDEWMAPENMNEIVSRAAAVGIPLAGLYTAGITGFSAVGITSGLATIGSYSGLAILGLNPMTAGIAGLIIAGVTIKKVADFALGSANANVLLPAEIERRRAIQTKATNRLAIDIPEYSGWRGFWSVIRRRGIRGLFRRSQMKEIARSMQSALLMLESGGTASEKTA